MGELDQIGSAVRQAKEVDARLVEGGQGCNVVLEDALQQSERQRDQSWLPCQYHLQDGPGLKL